MEEIITKGDKKFTDLGLHNLYERVKGEGWELKQHSFSLYFCLSYPDGFNRYMDTIGGYISVGSSGDQRSRQDVFHISDSTTLIHFLSIDREASSEATMETDYLTMNGWLLTVILDIVSMTCHVLNCFREHGYNFRSITIMNSLKTYLQQRTTQNNLTFHPYLLRQNQEQSCQKKWLMIFALLERETAAGMGYI